MINLVPETKGASIILLQVLEKLEIWGENLQKKINFASFLYCDESYSILSRVVAVMAGGLFIFGSTSAPVRRLVGEQLINITVLSIYLPPFPV